MITQMGYVLIVAGALLAVGIVAMFVNCYHKVEQGSALIRNGVGGTRVSFGGMLVFPVIHRYELMDISVKRIEIDRMNTDGLVCKDNMRAETRGSVIFDSDAEICADSRGFNTIDSNSPVTDFTRREASEEVTFPTTEGQSCFTFESHRCTAR